jgi:hypothetical protein
MFVLAIALTLAVAPKITVENTQQQQLNPLEMATAQEAWAAATHSAERLVLPKLRSPIKVEVSPFSHTIRLTAKGQIPALARAMREMPSVLCPQMEVTLSAVLLQCKTTLLDVSLSEGRRPRFLDIRQLRGLPYRVGHGGFPLVGYPPEKILLGGPCPGTTPNGKGECRLMAGDRKGARDFYIQALHTVDWPFAALRLGDLALAEENPATALAWYDRASGLGGYGRLATLRLCELKGTCDSKEHALVFESFGLPNYLKLEVDIRAARYQAFKERMGLASALVLKSLGSHHRDTFDAKIVSLIRQIDLAAFNSGEIDEQEVALAVYLWLRGIEDEMSVPLATSAAETAQRLGAPVFAGQLLASVTSKIPAPQLPDHLLRTAELYLDGEDRIRAGMIYDFAESRLRKATMATARWKAVWAATFPDRKRGLTAPVVPTFPESDSSSEIAAAVLALSRARSAQLSGAQP